MITHSEEFDLMNHISENIFRETQPLRKAANYTNILSLGCGAASIAAFKAPILSLSLGGVGLAAGFTSTLTSSQADRVEDQILKEFMFDVLTLNTNLRNQYSEVHYEWPKSIESGEQ